VGSKVCRSQFTLWVALAKEQGEEEVLTEPGLVLQGPGPQFQHSKVQKSHGCWVAVVPFYDGVTQRGTGLT
jgi:hypothetical protein